LLVSCPMNVMPHEIFSGIKMPLKKT